MNLKTFIGLVLLASGVFLIIYSLNAMHQFSVAKGLSKDVQNFFTHNPKVWNWLVKFFGGTPQEEAATYDLAALAMLVSGIVLSIGGSVVAWAGWASRRR